MKRRSDHNFWIRMTVLASIAGVLYSSWPLGYILNPTINRNQLASALEAIHQPYNWVFIGGDVSSSLLMILICWWLWRHYHRKKQRAVLGFVLINVVIFGLGTIFDTLLPEHCLPTAVTCPSWQHDHLLLAHGVFSILASVCLFLALLVLWWRNRVPLMNALMLGYSVFGLLSLYEGLNPNQGNFSQHYYITLCSVVMAVIPYGIYRTFLAGTSGKKSSS
jgi:hypothetical protein